ncbi:holo-ACP synthase [Flavihumibacter sp. UBA7668]|uniref:holo-ACP synthase n=1 Tax=Flavihumibacter sp. UBA7668 TaxID=1946542 RepID=UPI0025BF0F23|nr:holo-ACP synthase [Flavihumibacter sp. UBA7668]
MILGTGIDLVEVDRIERSLKGKEGFRKLVFSAGEIAYCEKQANPYQHYAARFAAKEAFLKALGTGWINGTAFHEIEIIHNVQGQPQINLLGETAQTLAGRPFRLIHVSLSHQKTMATAVVLLED